MLYAENFTQGVSLMAGANFRREAPRALDLDRADGGSSTFKPVTTNNLTLNFYTPFVAVDGGSAYYFDFQMSSDVFRCPV